MLYDSAPASTRRRVGKVPSRASAGRQCRNLSGFENGARPSGLAAVGVFPRLGAECSTSELPAHRSGPGWIRTNDNWFACRAGPIGRAKLGANARRKKTAATSSVGAAPGLYGTDDGTAMGLLLLWLRSRNS